jgi:hypothetical protein
MNTSSVITDLVRLNPDWTRPQILDVVNNVVNQLLKIERDSSVYLSPTTGNLPFLTTTAGTFTYTVTIPGISIWKIRSIVVDANDTINETWSLSDDCDREYETVRFTGRVYNNVPGRANDEADTGTPGECEYTFLVDPGTTTNKYRIMAYVATTPILSESINIPINDSFRNSVVIPAVQVMIDGMDNGRLPDAVEYIDTKLAPKLKLETTSDRTRSLNYTY